MAAIQLRHDRFRINGPDFVVEPPPPRSLTDSSNSLGPLETPGRRKLFATLGVSRQADGSVYLEMGRTKIFAAWGREYLSEGKLECTFKFATFSQVARRSHMKVDEERKSELDLVGTLSKSVQLHQYPKSLISISCTVLEDDGGAMSASTIASSLALADAGIELYDLVASCSACVIDRKLVIDPSTAVEPLQSARYGLWRIPSNIMICYLFAWVSFMPSLEEVCGLVQSGEIEFSVQNSAIQECIKACREYHKEMRQCLRNSFVNKDHDK
eukprot:UC4_evm1s1241